MLESEMIADVRRGCRNTRLSSSDISAVLLRGVTVLGTHIKQADPAYYLTRKSLSSTTHVFDKPSDCTRIEKIWDLGTTAKAVTAIDTGSFPYVLPISLGGGGLVIMTVPSHGLSENAIVHQHDIGGATEANGVFRINYIDADTYALEGTGHVNTYTSGGYVFVPPSSPSEIKRIILADASLDHTDKWYSRGNDIIVDDDTFTNDVLIDYEQKPTAITDIPDEYHEGIVAFSVVKLIRIPDPEHKTFADIMESKKFHSDMYKMVVAELYKSLKVSSEPQYIKNVWG